MNFPWLQTYSETRGHNFTVNATFDDIDFSKYDGLVIPGGRAPEYLAVNESVLELVRKFADAKKPIASICHGQLVLAAAGLVKGRKCTAFPSLRPVLVAAGAHWVEPETRLACVVDGNMITGVTYKGHPKFIRLFVKALGGNITGADKRILFLCGVCSILFSFVVAMVVQINIILELGRVFTSTLTLHILKISSENLFVKFGF